MYEQDEQAGTSDGKKGKGKNLARILLCGGQPINPGESSESSILERGKNTDGLYTHGYRAGYTGAD